MLDSRKSHVTHSCLCLDISSLPLTKLTARSWTAPNTGKTFPWTVSNTLRWVQGHSTYPTGGPHSWDNVFQTLKISFSSRPAYLSHNMDSGIQTLLDAEAPWFLGFFFSLETSPLRFSAQVCCQSQIDALLTFQMALKCQVVCTSLSLCPQERQPGWCGVFHSLFLDPIFLW